jgi:hypothetical protein
MEFWRSGTKAMLKLRMGVPLYYTLLGKKLFGHGVKYPLLRLAGMPDRLLSKRLYLNFSGYKRNPHGMDPFEGEILPAFQSVREKGLNLIDASQLHMHASGN